jgi:murein DD-endopeptidase MepM/ murein hydrolase activator NlpD
MAVQESSDMFDKIQKGAADASVEGWGSSFGEWRSLFEDMGIESQEQLDQFLDDYNAYSYDRSITPDEMEERWPNFDDMEQTSRRVLSNMSQIAYQGEEGKNASFGQTVAMDKAASILAEQLGIEEEISTFKQLQATYEWRMYTVNKKNAEALRQETLQRIQAQNAINVMFGGTSMTAAQMALMALNAVRMNLGLKPAKYLVEEFRDTSKEAADETGKIAKNIAEWKSGKISIDIQKGQWKDMLKDTMQGISEDYADAVSDNFDNAMENSIDANAEMWENRIGTLEDQQERAAEALDRRHENIMDAFDERWEKRTDRVTEYWDNRIEKIDDAIEAEQKAEEIRQRIFEAEQTRLDRLTEAANRGIDFNMALQTGDLDEAAKIRNDMDAAAQQWALSDAAGRGANASQRRIDRLENRQDGLQDQRDEALEALQKMEEDRRKSLERRLEQEKKHLDKVQEARMEALREESEANQEHLREQWEMRRENLDDQLDTFKAFIPKNQAQMERWIKSMGGEFRTFGTGTLSPLSEKWGGWFESKFKKHMRDAATDVGSNNMWEDMSAKVARQIIRGMGFPTFGGLTKFVTTGKLPGNFGKPNQDGNDNPFWMGRRPEQWEERLGTLHEGGVVGGGGYSRKGVARTAGLHPSEQFILAQKGEGVVNRNAMQTHGDLVKAINDGVFDKGVHRGNGILGGEGPGMAGLFAGMFGVMLAKGVGKALNNAVIQKAAEIARARVTGVFGTAGAGTYGDTAFSVEQLQNAATIANVGKRLGASSRDIVIALMTAMQESTLRNLDYGHLDSVGLFQQRDAWGSFADRTNPAKAAEMFFKGGAAGQRGLFDFPDRGSMSLTEAAQAVQVSAYPSAYAKWENEARAILSALSASGSGTGSNDAGYVPGPGGKHKPVQGPWSSSYNIHGSPKAVDLAVPVGRDVYAVNGGRVRTSADLRGDEPRAPHGGLGYRSYGRYIVIDHPGGASTLYAHLSKRFAREGQSVAGGSVIGKSGNTGYSYGPHLHFGATNGPLSWLKTGGMTLNDGIAMLHRGETVMTEPLTRDLQDMVKAFGKTSRDMLSGRSNGYSLDRLQGWARAQVGKPYRWGKIGPTGYDCSGLQSAITQLMKGNPPHQQRLFYTGNMASVIPGLGFKRGAGGANDYTVGWRTGDPGHTSGKIGNMGIESTGNAVRSAGATPPGAFPNVWHFPLRRPAQHEPQDNLPSTNQGDRTAEETTPRGPVKPDNMADTGFWTYLSGMYDPMGAIKRTEDLGNPAAGSPGTIRTGAYNVSWRSSDAGVRGALARLAPKADVLSLNEVYQGRTKVMNDFARTGWGVSGKTDSWVVWKKAVYDMVKDGNIWMNPRTKGKGPNRTRNAAYALLKNKSTGQKFWQIAAHTQPWPNKNVLTKAIQREQYNTLGNLVNRLEQTAPVILAGDLNERESGINIGGLTSNWHKNMKAGTQTHGKHWIDHVMYNDAIMNLIGNQTIGGLSSDHNAVLSQLNIPSHKDGAMNIKWDNTLVNAHEGEGILTKPQNSNFKFLADNLHRLALGGGNQYDIKVEVKDSNASPDAIARKVMQQIEKHEARKPMARR